MRSYKNATELHADLQGRWEGWTPNEVMSLVGELCATIGQWESNDTIAAKTMSGMAANIIELNRQVDEVTEENQAMADANATFVTEALAIAELREALSKSDAHNIQLFTEVNELTRAVDQLIDEKRGLTGELEHEQNAIEAIERVIALSK